MLQTFVAVLILPALYEALQSRCLQHKRDTKKELIKITMYNVIQGKD